MNSLCLICGTPAKKSEMRPVLTSSGITHWECWEEIEEHIRIGLALKHEPSKRAKRFIDRVIKRRRRDL